VNWTSGGVPGHLPAARKVLSREGHRLARLLSPGEVIEPRSLFNLHNIALRLNETITTDYLADALVAPVGHDVRMRGESNRKRVVLAAIRAYRRVSPRLPTRCRYTPTCSAYGLEAVQRYGARKGLRLTAARLRRCRPGVPYGTPDPVP
jgi:putative membrane protein insertion efficiency factor